jgi:iron complex transport system substrate-binding protein
MKHHAKWAALTLAALLVSACGGDDEPEATATPDEAEEQTDTSDEEGDDAAADEPVFPVTVGTGDSAVEIPAQPESIVSLSPTATEVLFAIGAGDQVVAVDEFSNHPADVPTTDLSGLTPNVEAITSFEPDLVIAERDPGDLVASLEQVGVPTLIQGAAVTLDDTYTQIEQLGAATGHVGEATELVGQMQTDIDAAIAEIPERDEPLTYYHELDNTYYSVTGETFIGHLYNLLGMQSIADAHGEGSGGYPQLSPEVIIDADPDVILLADVQCCGVTAETLAERPGWDELGAVQDGRVIELDADIASRWGPRVVDFLEMLAAELNELVPADVG